MTRRIVALAGFVAVVALALLLLYRVYEHHTQAQPYVDDDPAVVQLSSPPDVKFAIGTP